MPFFLPIAAGIATVCMYVNTLFDKEPERKDDLHNQKSSGCSNNDSNGRSRWMLMNGDDQSSIDTVISSIYPQKRGRHVVKKNPHYWLVGQHITFNFMQVVFDLSHGDDYDSSGFTTHSQSPENYKQEGVDLFSLETSSPPEFYSDQHRYPPLLELAVQSRWMQLRCILKGKRGLHRCQERDETGLTLLGAALGYHAPLDIIKLIISIDPNQLTAVDVYGANALHVACLNGTPYASVSYILEKCGELASARDKDDRVPLHHITECICRDEIEFVEGLRIIDVLRMRNPAMIHAQDRCNNSPLDLVHIERNKKDLSKDTSKRLIKLSWFLRKISFKVYKKHKKRWEQRYKK